MEAIGNVATAAAKAVWGDQNAQKEPLSGAKGDVSRGEPYDAGNMEPARQEQVEHSLESRNEGRTGADNFEKYTGPESNSEATRENEYLPLSSNENNSTPEYSRDTASVPQYSRENESIPKSTTENTVASEYDTEMGRSEQFSKTTSTSESRDDSSTDASKRAEGLEGYDSLPNQGFASQPEGTTKPEKTAFENTTSNSRRTNVPEPTPLESKSTDKDSNNNESSEGTGQEYVRSTGFAADGGDFDASNPGAGREADRLWEQKGNQNDDEVSGGSHGHKDKPSLGHRIKEKLHISKD